MGLFSKDIKTLDDLFVHTLQDIYYAENQITKALPTMIAKATDPQLKQGFQTHLAETQNQIKRLEQVFQMHGHSPKGVTCPAIDGIITEANEIIGEVADKEVLEGLFAPHLRAAGILVSPIHGITKAPAIAGIELVRKMPGVRRALLVDALAEHAIPDLMAMSDTELESHAAHRATSIEGKYVAALLRALPLAWRESLEIYSHGEQDVIALLDERALDDALPESYPGHDVVRERFAVEGKSFKSLMRDYGFRSNDRDWQVDFVKRVVAAMRAAGTRPERLEEIIAQIATRPNRSS